MYILILPPEKESHYSYYYGEYNIYKRVISIDPYIKDLVCPNKASHHTCFKDIGQHIVVHCNECNTDFEIGYDPYFRDNMRLKNIEDDRNILYAMPILTLNGIKSLLNIYTLEGKLPIMIHTGTKPEQDPKNMMKFMSSYQGNICVCHFARFDNETLKFVKNHDNIFVDTCPAAHMYQRYIMSKKSHGLFCENFSCAEEFYYRIFDVLGMNKVIWGSDYPYGNVKNELDLVNQLKISKEDKERLLFKNASNYLNLSL